MFCLSLVKGSQEFVFPKSLMFHSFVSLSLSIWIHFLLFIFKISNFYIKVKHLILKVKILPYIFLNRLQKFQWKPLGGSVSYIKVITIFSF